MQGRDVDEMLQTAGRRKEWHPGAQPADIFIEEIVVTCCCTVSGRGKGL